MLYLFAGTDRETSVKAALGRFSLQFGKEFTIECEEWDICRDPAQDLLDEETQRKLLERIRNGEFVAVLLSPPCASWSRAPWAKQMGPKTFEDFHASVGDALVRGSKVRESGQKQCNDPLLSLRHC